MKVLFLCTDCKTDCYWRFDGTMCKNVLRQYDTIVKMKESFEEARGLYDETINGNTDASSESV